MIVRTVPEYYKAEQWQHGRDIAGVFWHTPPATEIVNRSTGERHKIQPAGYWAIRTNIGIVQIHRGDWILTGPQGQRHVTSNDLFSIEYEPAPEREIGPEWDSYR